MSVNSVSNKTGFPQQSSKRVISLLESLPTSLFSTVMTCLPPRDMVSLSLTCRSIRTKASLDNLKGELKKEVQIILQYANDELGTPEAFLEEMQNDFHALINEITPQKLERAPEKIRGKLLAWGKWMGEEELLMMRSVSSQPEIKHLKQTLNDVLESVENIQVANKLQGEDRLKALRGISIDFCDNGRFIEAHEVTMLTAIDSIKPLSLTHSIPNSSVLRLALNAKQALK